MYQAYICESQPVGYCTAKLWTLLAELGNLPNKWLFEKQYVIKKKYHIKLLIIVLAFLDTVWDKPEDTSLTWEILARISPLRRGKWLGFLAIAVLLAFSALYEIIEWMASLSNPTGTETFLGTQGDIWDTQTDMLWCLMGSIVAITVFTKLHNKYLLKNWRILIVTQRGLGSRNRTMVIWQL